MGIPHPLIISRENQARLLRDQLLPTSPKYAVKEGPKLDLSYSVSYKDYEYLKRHKVVGQDSPFNPDLTDPTPVIVDKHKHVKQDVPCSNVVLKRSAGTNSIDEYNNILVSAPLEPIVHKHVYFHVPPPDFEEPHAVPRLLPPRKKKVNILIIKVPSYEPSLSYLESLRSQALIEDKTLIYVLSKKENPHLLEAPRPAVVPPTPPEVYFVKYRTPNNIAANNNDLSVSRLLQNVSPSLELSHNQ